MVSNFLQIVVHSFIFISIINKDNSIRGHSGLVISMLGLPVVRGSNPTSACVYSLHDLPMLWGFTLVSFSFQGHVW